MHRELAVLAELEMEYCRSAVSRDALVHDVSSFRFDMSVLFTCFGRFSLRTCLYMSWFDTHVR